MPKDTSTTTSPAVDKALADLVTWQLVPKNFVRTGSKGFYGGDKIRVDGKRYQASSQAVLIGSKTTPKVKVRATAEQVRAAITAELVDPGVDPWLFGSGKRGYYAQGKVRVGEETFQASVQAVELAGQ